MHTLTELGNQLAGAEGEKLRTEISRKLMDIERRLRASMSERLLPQTEFHRFSVAATGIDCAQKVVAGTAELPNLDASQPLQ